MLAIRMQRTGRKGHPEFRVIVQDSALSPTSGRVVARVGHHNPHSKETVLDVDKISFYLENGAQPSERVVKLLKDQKVKLPKWVEELDTKKQSKIRNPEKLRRNQPNEPEAPAEEPAAEAPTEEEPEASEAEVSTESEKPTEEAAPEAPAEEKAEKPAAETDEKPEEAEKATE